MSSCVDHPEHYNHGGVECIDAIRSALTKEEFCGFLKGNIIKYIWREQYKGRMYDIRKANWYLFQLMTERANIGSSGDVPQEASSGSAADTD